MSEGLLSALILGLVSAGHCAGMCGGIVAAFNLQSATRRSIVSLNIAYNLGRVATYGVLGGIAGALGGASLMLDHVFPIQSALRLLANLMLVALGFYLMGFTRLLAPIERVGFAIWRHIQPYTRFLLPADRPHRALALGVLWGFLPCGLVYSILVTALASGGTLRGIATMLAFGLGTLPSLLFASLFLRQPRAFKQARTIRAAFGAIVAGLGLFGLMHGLHTSGV